MSYVVNVGFDQAEARYYVLSSDIDGLHVEAASFDIARDFIPDLLGDKAHGSSISFRRELEIA